MSDQFKSYIPPDQDMKEISFKAILLGIIMAVILGAANAYLGLLVGMTVAATFPAVSEANAVGSASPMDPADAICWPFLSSSRTNFALDSRRS